MPDSQFWLDCLHTLNRVPLGMIAPYVIAGVLIWAAATAARHL